MLYRFVICILILLLAGFGSTVIAEDEHDHGKEQASEEAHDDHGGHDEVSKNGAEPHDDHGEESAHEDIVELTKAELQEFGIVISKAGSGTLKTEITVPGEVVVNYDRLAHIAPRFPGVVKSVFKHLGDRVKKGDVLAVVESNEGLFPYEIKSLLDGVVIEKHITIGEVRTEQDAAFVIADLDTVWVNLSIYQMHLPYVQIGQEVTISSGQEFSDVTRPITYLSPIVDEHTRTATARVVLANHDRDWRPGLFVEGKIVAKEEHASIVVPKSAIQKFEGNDVVFISTPEGFKPTVVKIGRKDLSSAEIVSGLTTGQKYVSKGGFTLKSELEKGSMSSGHSH